METTLVVLTDPWLLKGHVLHVIQSIDQQPTKCWVQRTQKQVTSSSPWTWRGNTLKKREADVHVHGWHVKRHVPTDQCNLPCARHGADSEKGQPTTPLQLGNLVFSAWAPGEMYPCGKLPRPFGRHVAACNQPRAFNSVGYSYLLVATRNLSIYYSSSSTA
jgi:hypothetical protein